MIQQQRHGGNLASTAMRVVSGWGAGSRGLLRGLSTCMCRDGIYTLGLLGVAPALQRWLEQEHGYKPAKASLMASLGGGIVAALPSHPLDVLKTCLQGDLEQGTYKGYRSAFRQLWSQGGLRRLYSGCMWRTINICATVYIANEWTNAYRLHMDGPSTIR